MKHKGYEVFLGIFILLSTLVFTACTPKEGVEIRSAWTRATPAGENGAIYFTITNYSPADTLVGVSTEVAEAVEFHESMLLNDVMEMHMLDSVNLPQGEAIEFAPGGLHVMLVNLQRELVIGETIEVTFHFEQGADQVVSIPVLAGPGHSEHDD